MKINKLTQLLIAMVGIAMLVGCGPPVGPIFDSQKKTQEPGPGRVLADTLWIELLRTAFDTSSTNNRFRPSVDMVVFATYEGAVFTIPVHETEVQICDNPNASTPVFVKVYNPAPNGNGNGNGYGNGNGSFYTFERNGRYLVRVLYRGNYSAPYSIQVGSISNIEIGGNKPDEGIEIVWSPLVQFDTKGGSKIPNERIDYGTQATEPPDPTRPGYVFAGWYSDPDTTVPYNFDAPVFTGTTIHAKWEPES